MRAGRAMRLIAATLLAVLALTGCGGGGGGSGQETGRSDAAGSPTTTAGTAAPDACRLITTDEVAQVLHEHSADQAAYTVTASSGSDGSCTYTWNANGGGDEFTVNEFPASSYVAQPGVEPRRIPDIGDEAFEEVGSFYARVGGRMVNVVNLQEAEGADEALPTIAVRHLN